MDDTNSEIHSSMSIGKSPRLENSHLEEVMKEVNVASRDIRDALNVDGKDPSVDVSADMEIDADVDADDEKGDSDDCFEDEVHSKKVPERIDDASTSLYNLPSMPASVMQKETDTGQTLFGCSLCEKFYKFKKSAEYHIKVNHRVYSLFCHICGKTFKIKTDLDRHLNVHKGVRPFPCPECEKSFVCRSSLMRHRKLHHLVGDIYKCHNCEKTFRAESDLKRHLYTHTGEKPWSCKLCTKSFVSKSSLKVHERSHDDSQKYSCAVCLKMFHIKGDLIRHESLHTGDLKWECAVCQRKYSGKSAVKRHVKDAHIFGKVKYTKEMKLVDLVSSIDESSKYLKAFGAFVKYTEDKSVGNLLKALDSFIIYKGGESTSQKECLETNLEGKQ